MKFLTDENVASSVVRELRLLGHDLKDVKEEHLYGLADTHILTLANREGRVIITHDKDFTSLSIRKHCGIILLRLKDQRPATVAQTLARVLASSVVQKITNNLVIVTESRTVVHSIPSDF